MLLKHNLIGGDWVAGPEIIRNVNPSDTRDCIGEYAAASADQARDAAAAARAAFPGWSRTNSQTRADILAKAATEILARKDELARLLSREEGKTLVEGIGEVARASQSLQFFAGEAVRLGGEKIPSVRSNVDVEVTREPVGVVAAITPWNFPIAIPAWKVASALAYGNTVVLKPAELTPAIAWEFIDVLRRAGTPPGVVNLVMGRGSVIGEALVEGVDAVTFTGSLPTGRRVAAKAIERLTRIQLEMGGKNPLVVLDDADIDIAVTCALNGAFFSTGQRCTASSRLIVTEEIHDQFVKLLNERVHHLVVDHALKEGTQIGPLIDERQLRQVQGYVALGRSEGAALAGGELLERETPGHYMAPALFTETSNTMRINREEIFGPVASVIRVRNYEEALSTANDTDFGLSSGICTTSLKFARHFQANSASGLVTVNLPTAGLDYHVPFGGRKASSYGPREQGWYAREFYTISKTSYVTG